MRRMPAEKNNMPWTQNRHSRLKPQGHERGFAKVVTPRVDTTLFSMTRPGSAARELSISLMAPLDSEPRAYRKNDEVMEETDNNSSDSEYEGEEDGLSSEKRFRERMDELLASLRTKTYEDLTNEGEKAHKSLINESEEYYHDLIDKHKTWICPQTKQIQKAVPIRFRNVAVQCCV